MSYHRTVYKPYPDGPDPARDALDETKMLDGEPYCPWCTDGIDPGDDWDALCEQPGCKPRTLYDEQPRESDSTAFGQGGTAHGED